MPTEPAWKRRFSAPRLLDFGFATNAPDRWAAVTNESGSWQAWSWDPADGRRVRISSDGIGAEEVHLTPDGDGVVWWLDETGDERGRWVVTPFAGGAWAPLLADVPDGWAMGISLVEGASAVGIATDDDYRVYVSRARRAGPRALPSRAAGRGRRGVAAGRRRPVRRRHAPVHPARRARRHRAPGPARPRRRERRHRRRPRRPREDGCGRRGRRSPATPDSRGGPR